MRDWVKRHRTFIRSVIASLIATAISTAILAAASHFLFPKNPRTASDDHMGRLPKNEENPSVKPKDEAAVQSREQEKRRVTDEAARLEKVEAARAALAAQEQAEEQRRQKASRQATLEEEARSREALAEQKQAEERKKREAEAVEEETRGRAALAEQKQADERKRREAEAVAQEARRHARFAGQTAFVSRLLRVEAVDVRRLANEIEITFLFTNLSNQAIWWTAGYTSRAITDRGYQYGFQTSFRDATNLIPGVPVRISYTFTGSDPTAQRVTVVLTQSSVYKPEPDIVVRNIPLL